MNELISIIIPVHNVEPYVEACLESVKNQTYKNTEVIMVVNASTDGSEAICKKYSENDSRFKLIVTEQGGLSFARNIALESAKGEYFAFVDSDDYVDDEYIEKLYKLIKLKNSKISVCNYKSVPQNSVYQKQTTNTEATIKHFSNHEYSTLYFTAHNTRFVTVWNKLYCRELFDNLKFPIGHLHEDEFISYKLLYAANEITQTDEVLYFYRHREGSIVHTVSGARYVDSMTAYSQRTDFFNSINETELANLSCISTLKWVVKFYYNICSSDSFSAIDLKKIFDKEYEIYKKSNQKLSDELQFFYEEFSKCPYKAHSIYLKLEYKEYKQNTSSKEVTINNLRNFKNNFRQNIKRDILFAKIKTGAKRQILNVDESLEILTKAPEGICRLGDGELTIIEGGDIGFQKYDDKLSSRLREIVSDENAPCYIGIPDEINMCDYENSTAKNRRYWIWHLLHSRNTWIKVTSPNIEYLTTNVTRPYMRFFDKSVSVNYFEQLRTLWDDKEIIIIEGEKSRLGIGNNLFSKSTIKRILCPSTNAFDYYDEILSFAKTLPKDTPIFIALGPTATILAYDLCKLGYKAFDIGHCDIEYEWMNLRTDTKIAIPSKFTNEADNGNQVQNCVNNEYLSQIIKKIGISD